MQVTTAIAIYFLIWWIVLFAVLPWGIHAQGEQEAPPGTDPGAPALPRLWMKLLWTTVASTVIWAVCAVIYYNRWVTLDDLAALFGFPKK